MKLTTWFTPGARGGTRTASSPSPRAHSTCARTVRRTAINRTTSGESAHRHAIRARRDPWLAPLVASQTRRVLAASRLVLVQPRRAFLAGVRCMAKSRVKAGGNDAETKVAEIPASTTSRPGLGEQQPKRAERRLIEPPPHGMPFAPCRCQRVSPAHGGWRRGRPLVPALRMRGAWWLPRHSPLR